MTYPAELAEKEAQLRSVLSRIGGFKDESLIRPMVASPKDYEYRNSIRLRLKRKKDSWQGAFIGHDNKSLVDVKRCPIAAPEINEMVKDLPLIVKDFEQPDKIFEVTFRRGNNQSYCLPRYKKPYRYSSKLSLTFSMGKDRLQYGLSSFFQVNSSMVPRLVDEVKRYFKKDETATLFDLYAGVGLFSIALRERFRNIIGVENNREAIFYFRKNVESTKAQNIKVIQGKVEYRIEALLAESSQRKKSVLIDPPREGIASQVCQALITHPVDQLIYVSCDPATFSRDAKKLSLVYELRSVTPLDLFPRTGHFELVANFEKKQKGSA